MGCQWSPLPLRGKERATSSRCDRRGREHTLPLHSALINQYCITAKSVRADGSTVLCVSVAGACLLFMLLHVHLQTIASYTPRVSYGTAGKKETISENECSGQDCHTRFPKRSGAGSRFALQEAQTTSRAKHCAACI